jgi:4'-phosphopantetheinyl transferase
VLVISFDDNLSIFVIIKKINIFNFHQLNINLSLERDEVAVIFIETNKFLPYVDRLFALLSPVERAKIESFSFDDLKFKNIIYRGVLRILLSRFIKINPQAILIRNQDQGKPFLCNNLDRGILEFNLSHSFTWAVYAFALNRVVGIDIEEDKNSIVPDDLVPLVFSSSERASFAKLNLDTQRSAFFKLWTQKEALSKNYGYGLLMDFKNIDIGFENKLIRSYENLLLYDLSNHEKYYAALAVNVKEHNMQRDFFKF